MTNKKPLCNAQLAVRMSKATREKLQRVADADDRKACAVARRMIEKALEEIDI